MKRPRAAVDPSELHCGKKRKCAVSGSSGELRGRRKRKRIHQRQRLKQQSTNLKSENAQLLTRIQKLRAINLLLSAKRNSVRKQASSRAKKAICPSLGCDALLDSFPFLDRWSLDAMPMVGQQFRLVYNGSTFVQHRMIAAFEHILRKELHRGPEHPNTIYVDCELLARWKRVFPFRKIVSRSECYSFELSDFELAELLAHTPQLRARNSVLVQLKHYLRILDESVKGFNSLWDGCPLEVKWLCNRFTYDGTIVGQPPKYLSNCSSLNIKLPGSNCLLPEAWAVLCDFPRIKINRLFYTYPAMEEMILDYLFASTRDGQKREAILKCLGPWLSPGLLKRRLKKRLAQNVGPHSPTFKLKLTVVGCLAREGNFELLSQPARQTVVPQHRCIFLCKKKSNSVYLIEVNCY